MLIFSEAFIMIFMVILGGEALSQAFFMLVDLTNGDEPSPTELKRLLGYTAAFAALVTLAAYLAKV